MNIYQIDDGATHTIAAKDEADAFGIYAKHLIRAGSDWPTEKPSIERLEHTKEFSLRLDGSDRSIKLAAMDWADIFSEANYLGCSEF